MEKGRDTRLEDEILAARSNLDQAIARGDSFEEYYELSLYMDQLLEEYIDRDTRKKNF